MIVTVPASGDVQVRVSGDLTHLCPFKDETDHGHITITWRVQGQTIELHALRAYLDSWGDAKLSHEEVTDRIRHDLTTTPGIEVVLVQTYWDTAGLGVVCATLPTPQGPEFVTP